ncbi:DUF488 family protein, N3 subclade [Candidatus Lokiarchaeum ossiferum]|uniref:DUF488 family protein, N3 subclade n=1 Tax=Candidatus Lokiarchaeum ossiferum TaxID=2951803 RepID=UPI00352FEBEF
MSLDNFVQVKKNQSVRTGINIGCYAAVMAKYQAKFPKAQFEVVMRKPWTVGLKDVHPSVLSPSEVLLEMYQYRRTNFKKFGQLFEKEIFTNRHAIFKLKTLKELSKVREVFLVCCERNPAECHRSILYKFLSNLEFYLKKWRIFS